MNENQLPPYHPRARKRGCVLKGCLVIFIVLMLMGMILGGIGIYFYRGFVSYFDKDPAAIRVYPATDAQYQAVLAKVQPFNRSMEAGTEAALELSADEVDILIARDPAWAEQRGRLYLAIVNNELVADVSTRAAEDENPRMPGFFNGRLILGASIAGGEFTAVMHRIQTLGGRPLPRLLSRYITSPVFSQAFDETINQRIKSNPEFARYLSRLRTAAIVKNHILLVSAGEPEKISAPASAAEPAPAASPAPTPVAAPTSPE